MDWKLNLSIFFLKKYIYMYKKYNYILKNKEHTWISCSMLMVVVVTWLIVKYPLCAGISCNV